MTSHAGVALAALDVKISLHLSGRDVSPACIAGVFTSLPNFNAPCRRTKL